MKKFFILIICVMAIYLGHTYVSDAQFVKSVNALSQKVVNFISGEDSNKKKDDTVDVMVYYKNKDNMIVPVLKRIKTEENLKDAVLTYMQMDLSKLNLVSAIKRDSIKNMTSKDRIVTINLKDEANTYKTRAEESAFVYSIVYALTEFEDVDSVMFYYKDKSSLKNGMKLNKLYYRDDINLVKQEKDYASKQTLYCYKDLVYIPYTVYDKSDKLSFKEILNKEMNYLKNERYSSLDIKKNMKILDAVIKDDTGYIHLSKGFNDIENEEMEKIQRSIMLTIKENVSGIEKIIFVIQTDDKSGIMNTIMISNYSNSIIGE